MSAKTGTAVEAAALGAAVDRLVATRPRVHALLAPVAQPFVANVAAALRIDISMTVDAREVRPMAEASDALLVNLGMMDEARRDGALAASATGCPFVLDPVKVDRVPARLQFAKEMCSRAPLIVKGNAAEMAALGALPRGAAQVTTGPVDRVLFQGRCAAILNGTPLLDRVVATGCAAGMLTAAMVAVEPDPLVAALSALALLSVAAEEAALTAKGPGSFAANLLDALGTIDGAHVAAHVRLEREDV